jgi:hypothetical protein
MTAIVLQDAAGRQRSSATLPGHHTGRPPRNKGLRYPADPPSVEEIVAVMRQAGTSTQGLRVRALVVILWRAGLRIGEALALTEGDLDERRGSVLVRHGKGDKRREVGMDDVADSCVRSMPNARGVLTARRGNRDAVPPITHGTAKMREAGQVMSQLLRWAAGLAAAALLATGAGLSAASPAPPSHLVYGCRFARIWKTPGHHPVGFISRRERFYVTRYSSSRRWALGTTGSPGSRLRSHGWVRHGNLCRKRPQ